MRYTGSYFSASGRKKQTRFDSTFFLRKYVSPKGDFFVPNLKPRTEADKIK